MDRSRRRPGRHDAPARIADVLSPEGAVAHIAVPGRAGAPAQIADVLSPEGALARIAVPGRAGAPVHVADAVRPDRAPPHIDALIAELASRQHGVVTLEQLRGLGLTDRAVRHRVRRGSLHRLRRRVFAVGHPAVSPMGKRLGAVLACGPRAVLSHGSAAALWGIRPSAATRHDVTVPVHRRGPAGVRVHCVRRLAPADIAEVDRIPVTSVARTLIDLAGIIDDTRLERALHEAEALRVLDFRQLERTLEGASGRRGTGVLRKLLAGSSPGGTRSDLEMRFLELCRAHELPLPRCNARTEGYEVDAVWPAEKLIVELDGAAFHDTRRAFRADRRRDAALAAAGYVVVRLTWDRVTGEAEMVAGELRAILARRRATAHISDAMGPERAPARNIAS